MSKDLIVLMVVVVMQIIVMYSVYNICKRMDMLQSDMTDLMDQERKQRQQCDNNIMLKLHERYDALVKWMDRMSKANRNTNNKKTRQ